ncbi:NifU-like protein [Bradyrhizobium macuxiense]|uniref:NifU-like protein n=1 Tax=Bradyrhizobium macuxiense TaxID=1755647 RepID=A0A560L1P5_9BRAD|nr:NifU family protein [Bradyrhizobium macuxiense]TWB89393.1 NifU-like protein [Bradyrhizobium macuxiense]
MLVPEPLKHPLLTETDQEQLIRAVIEETRPNLRCDGSDGRLVEIGRSRSMVKPTGTSVLCKLSFATLESIQARLIEKLGKFVGLIPVAAAAKARN